MSEGGEPALRTLRWGVDLDADDLPSEPARWLRALGGPTQIVLSGADDRRTRVVTTLLHGNEPSGFEAIHRYLRAGERPATQTRLLIASVGPALEAPVFSHRQRPGHRDLNRCFGVADLEAPADAEARLARALFDAVVDAAPEALVDLHNNSGHNPAYGVAVGCDAPELALVALFADRVVHAPLALGTLVEALVDRFPSVTVECGRAGDPRATDAAYAGLVRFLAHERPDRYVPPRPLRVLSDPIRVCIAPGVALAFDDVPRADVLLTVSADIDHHNFERLPEGSVLGWVSAGGEWPLVAFATDGSECSRSLFRIEAGVLETRRAFTPIMMTTRPDIAKSDCLFYAARDGDVEPDGRRG